MAIDTIRLRKGEKVECQLCNEGIMKPVYNTLPEKATTFVCSHCGEKLHINLRMNKPSK